MISPDTGKNRWVIYFQERFPLGKHGIAIAAFSSCAVSFASLLPPVSAPPSWRAFLVAFVSCFGFFLQLRIADEFKDFEEDSRYRPDRAVPRGLVKLRELGWIFAGLAAVQAGLAMWLQPKLLILLAVTWTYLALMSVEFFARDWLKKRPITYLWTHMLIMPLVDLYATSSHWLPLGRGVPSGLGWFLALSFTNGLVIEIGRKIRMPSMEQEGVPTYSKLWGMNMAAFIWLCLVVTTDLLALTAASRIGFLWPIFFILPIPIYFATRLVRRTLLGKNLTQEEGKQYENLAGLWTVVLYFSLGLIPLIIHVLRT